MRKHFLLLFLMALLPLAGWADTGDISQAQILVQDFEFGGFAKEGDAVLGDKPAVSVYFTTQQGVIAVPNEYLTIGEIRRASDKEVVLSGVYGHDQLATLPKGSYEIKVTGHTNFSGTAWGTFEVVKATLTIASTQSFIVKDFGTANPTFWEGVGINTISASNHGSAVNLPDNFKKLITYTQTQTAANADGTEGAAFLPADPARTAGYTLNFAGLTNSEADQAALADLIDDADELANALQTLETFAENYTIKYPEVTMKIKQVAIASPFVTTDNGFYATINEPSRDANNKIVYTYNGLTQTPATADKMTIEYKNADDFKANKYNLTSNEQYDVVYTYSADGGDNYEALAENELPLKAGFYKVYVKGKINTATLNTNFYTAADVEVAAAAFQIKKADLQLLINPKNEQYTGVTYTTASFTPSGLVAGDQGKIKKSDIKFNVQVWNAALETPAYGEAVELGANNSVKNVGRYKVSFKTANEEMMIQTGVNANNEPVYGRLDVNYNIMPIVNEWYITPKQGLVITAGSVDNHPYNTALVDQDVTVTGAVNDTEKQAIEAAWTGKVSNTASITTYGEQPAAFIPTRVDAQDEDATALMANYAVLADVDDVTDDTKTHLISGTLTVIGNAFTIYPIIPNDDNIVYDGQAHKATQLFATANNQMLVEGVDFEAADENGIQILYKKANTDDEFSADFEPKDAGAYLMKVANVKGMGSFATVTEPVCTEILFEIAPKPLTYTIANVSLWSGATLAHLNAKVDFNRDEISEAIVPNDDVKGNFFLTTPDENAKYAVDEDGTITFSVGYVASNIVEVELTGADAANYEVKYTNNEKGMLTQTDVQDNMPLALNFTAEDAEKIADATDICALPGNTKYNVTIGDKDSNKKMLAKEWYAMVLPFDVTPAELVSKLGTYVVVNKIKGSSMKNNVVTVNFELEMDEIKAGTPFIIKPATEVNWYKKTSDLDLTNSIKFTDKVIKKGIADTDDNAANTEFASLKGTYDNDKSLQWGHDLDGNEEPGFTYAGANTDWSTATLKYRWLCDTSYGKKDKDGNLVNQWLNCKNNAHNLKPMEAYMVLDQEAVGVHVLVEDFENGTTTIKSLSADNIQDLKVAEGWYTINGMKLNAAPTEKGIYINNGKKVVVK